MTQSNRTQSNRIQSNIARPESLFITYHAKKKCNKVVELLYTKPRGYTDLTETRFYQKANKLH